MMQLPFTTLDVFTTTRYRGNPLAIIRVPSHLSASLTETQKQQIATEFNLSETVFLHEPADPNSSAPVLYDIFTSKSRIPFAGHPTIGTAIYTKLYAADVFKGLRILTTPLAGNVPMAWDEESRTARVLVPHELRVHRERLPHPMQEQQQKPDVPIVSIVKGMSFIMVPLPDLKRLGIANHAGESGTGSIVPPADTYKGLHLDQEDGWNVGIVNTMYYVDAGGRPTLERGYFASDEWLLRTRVIGRIEDPGTGSASCALCCYLALGLHEGMGEGPFRFHLVQGVEMGRQCDIYVKVTRTGDGKEVNRVELEGTAVKVMEGVIEV